MSRQRSVPSPGLVFLAVGALWLAGCSSNPTFELPDPAEQVEAQEWEADSSDRLHSALQRLDERSRDIVQRRWMTEDKATLHELADKYGVSAERIRQIEANALTKLRGMMAVA